MVGYVAPTPVPTPTTGTIWPEYFSTSRDAMPMWAKTLRRTSSVTAVSTLLPNSNVILTLGVQVCGALGSGRDQAQVDALIASVSADGGATYRNCIKNEAVKGVQAQTNNHTIYWHIGNEINSQHYATTMGTTGASSDPSMIPDFVEYFVAPTVQGLDEASSQTGFDTPAVLGSIVSGHNINSRAWLDTLLNYTITGTYAPALAGKKVYEVVDYTSFHYTVASTIWEESFNDIGKWIGQGKIKGIIDTEELGSQSMARGAAQFQALQGFVNLMYWVNAHGYTPVQGRLNFWAQGDSTPDEAMTIVYNFLGNTSLKNLTNPTLIGQTGSPSVHALSTTAGDKRLISVLTPQGLTGSFTAIQFPAEGWSSGSVSGTLYVFKTTTGTDKYTTEPITATLSNGTYTITRTATLPTEGAVVVMLTNSGTSTPPPPTPDTTAPTTPTSLAATPTSTTQINLSWTASTDAVGVTGYRIYRNGTQITTTTGTTYSNTGLTAATTYTYTVQAYDAAGNSSAQTAGVSATTQSTTPVSTKFTLNQRIQTTATLNIRSTANGTLLGSQTTGILGTITGGPTYTGGYHWWNVNFDSGVDGWAVENWMVGYVAGGTGTAGNYSFTGPITGKTIPFRVYLPPSYSTQTTKRYPVIYHLHGAGAKYTSGTDKIETPYAAYMASGKLPESIIVFPDGNLDSFWANSYDGSVLIETNVIKELVPYIDATYRTIATRESRAIQGFSMGGFGAMEYAVKFPSLFGTAVGLDGALTVYSDLLRVHPEIILKMFNNNEASFGLYSPYYNVQLNQSTIRTLNTKFFVLVGQLTTDNGNWTNQLTALGIPYQFYDSACQHSFACITGSTADMDAVAAFLNANLVSTTATPDITAPTTPASLTATPASTTQVNLSWTASTDNVGVTGYRIYRNGTLLTTTTTTSYSNTGLTAATTYTYTVQAYDGAGNSSAQTAGVSATTQSGTTTTAPPSITFAANSNSIISGGAIVLNWVSVNASSCTANGGWAGSKSIEGSETISGITANNTYDLSCTGTGGTTTQTVSVAVNGTSSGTGSTTTGGSTTGSSSGGGTTTTTGGSTPSTGTPPTTTSSLPALTQTLALGSRGDEVSILQQMLAQDKSVYPEGEVTGYFGTLTQAAVERFQTKYGIVTGGSPATTGYGQVGPATRTQLNALYAGTTTATGGLTEEQRALIMEQIRLLQEQVKILLEQLVLLLLKGAV